MTREEAIRGHRAMWGWLAKHPGETKKDYLKKFDPEANLWVSCYLCEYAEHECKVCPLEWPYGDCLGRGLFGQWCDAIECDEYTRAAEIARQIAKLPEREVER